LRRVGVDAHDFGGLIGNGDLISWMLLVDAALEQGDRLCQAMSGGRGSAIARLRSAGRGCVETPSMPPSRQYRDSGMTFMTSTSASSCSAAIEAWPVGSDDFLQIGGLWLVRKAGEQGIGPGPEQLLAMADSWSCRSSS
jgi:hypothetical protein